MKPLPVQAPRRFEAQHSFFRQFGAQLADSPPEGFGRRDPPIAGQGQIGVPQRVVEHAFMFQHFQHGRGGAGQQPHPLSGEAPFSPQQGRRFASGPEQRHPVSTADIQAIVHIGGIVRSGRRFHFTGVRRGERHEFRIIMGAEQKKTAFRISGADQPQDVVQAGKIPVEPDDFPRIPRRAHLDPAFQRNPKPYCLSASPWCWK